MLLVLAFALQSMSRQQLRMAINRVHYEQAQTAADGGLVMALQQLASNPTYSGQTTSRLADGPEQFSVQVLKGESRMPDGQAIPQGCLFVLAAGQVRGSSLRRSGALVRPGTSGLKGLPGIFGESVVFSNGSGLDSYDSRTGKYKDLHKLGTLVTNSVTAGSVRLLGGSKLEGSISVGPKGTLEPDPASKTTTVGKPFTIWRDWGNFYNSASLQTTPLQLPVVELPGPPGKLDVKLGNKDKTLTPGNYDKLEVNGGARVKLAAGVYVFNEVELNGGAQIAVASDAPVKIYVADNFALNNGANFSSPSNKPTLLQVYLADGAEYEQSGGTILTGIVYGPGARVKMENSATLYGSVVGKQVTLQGSANVHYDEALRDFSLGAGSSGAPGELQVLFRQRW
ncbi:hypothetical protein IV102_11980 [bacterium]|nr:hypothetical protein [bacterium]